MDGFLSVVRVQEISAVVSVVWRGVAAQVVVRRREDLRPARAMALMNAIDMTKSGKAMSIFDQMGHGR